MEHAHECKKEEHGPDTVCCGGQGHGEKSMEHQHCGKHGHVEGEAPAHAGKGRCCQDKG